MIDWQSVTLAWAGVQMDSRVYPMRSLYTGCSDRCAAPTSCTHRHKSLFPSLVGDRSYRSIRTFPCAPKFLKPRFTALYLLYPSQWEDTRSRHLKLANSCLQRMATRPEDYYVYPSHSGTVCLIIMHTKWGRCPPSPVAVQDKGEHAIHFDCVLYAWNRRKVGWLLGWCSCTRTASKQAVC